MRRVLTMLSTLATAAAVVVGAAGTAQAATYTRYVALGDSFASVGTLTMLRTDPLGCFRATDNYPSGVAARLGVAAFVDVTCGGATTVHMTQPQSVPLGQNAPQLTALTADTDLVTLTIGGNDIGFGEIVQTCATLSLTNPFGAPCQAHYAAGGVDQLGARIAQTATLVDAVLAGVHARAPQARVVVVGYLRILPPTTGCWPLVPFASGDVAYFDGVEHRLNGMLGERAAANGATFVNPGETTGHDVCQLPGNKWVEGLIPTSLSAPVHPNATGQAHVADLVAAALA
jgi:lysophospholipase L1-like esterase